MVSIAFLQLQSKLIAITRGKLNEVFDKKTKTKCSCWQFELRKENYKMATEAFNNNIGNNYYDYEQSSLKLRVKNYIQCL